MQYARYTDVEKRHDKKIGTCCNNRYNILELIGSKHLNAYSQ